MKNGANKIAVILIVKAISSFVFAIHAQTSIKLPTHNIIGTELSVDYATNTPSTIVNTKSNVFDGNLNTYFASYERSGTWVGLDLSERYVITKIAYAPRNNDPLGPQRLLLGIFEGANNPDFSDAVPLYMITEEPLVYLLTEQTINCSRGFRYVRYAGPNDARCTIAEIEFYGYKDAGNNTHFPQLTNLPTITISTQQAAEIDSRDEYISGFISIIHNGTIYSDLLEIRGRGHGSWTFPKKPYRIKLRNKTRLLGFPASERNWTLLNNYGDKTLMRNLLAFDLSRRLDMDYTPAGMPVDVIINGEYKGNYQLCDQIEVAPGRVEIQQLTPKDVDLPNLSGGYLLELDANAPNEEEGWFYSTVRQTPMRIRAPKEDEIVAQQYFYIRDHYRKMEESLFATNYKDPENGYRKYIDTESFIRHFLVGEISGNTDTYWSVYLYKERNSDMFKFGPVWDFDLAFENDYRTFPINASDSWVWESGSAARGVLTCVRRLLSDENFVSQLKDIYFDYRNRGVITKDSLLQVIDTYAFMIDRSQRLNFMRWNILNRAVQLNPQILGTYENEVNNVKRYISERIDWMDNKLGYVTDGNTYITSNLPDIEVYAYKNIIYFSNVFETVKITIADITGRIIFSQTIQENTSISVANGMYLITISNAKGQAKTVKCLVS